MVLGIQILGVLFGLFMLYFTYLHFKRNEFKAFETMIWTLLWIILLFITLFPNSLDFFVKGILRLKRPLDFFIICGFLLVMLVTFLNYSANKRIAKKVDKLVSELAQQNPTRKN